MNRSMDEEASAIASENRTGEVIWRPRSSGSECESARIWPVTVETMDFLIGRRPDAITALGIPRLRRPPGGNGTRGSFSALRWGDGVPVPWQRRRGRRRLNRI